MFFVIKLKSKIKIAEDDRETLNKCLERIQLLKKIILSHFNGAGILVDVWNNNEIILVLDKLNMLPNQRLSFVQFLFQSMSRVQIFEVFNADITFTDIYPRRPFQEKDTGLLQAAILKDDIEEVKKLASNQSLLNSYDKNRVSPLCLAVQLGKPGIVEILLEHGAGREDTRDVYTQNTPLHIAVEVSNPDCCRLLLSDEENLFALNRDRISPLASALKIFRASQGDAEKLKKIKLIIDQLLNFGAGIGFDFSNVPAELLSNKVLLGAHHAEHAKTAITTKEQFLQKIPQTETKFWYRQLKLICIWLPNNVASKEINALLKRLSSTASLELLAITKVRDALFHNKKLNCSEMPVVLSLSSVDTSRRHLNFFSSDLKTMVLPQILADDILEPIFISRGINRNYLIEIIRTCQEKCKLLSENGDLPQIVYYSQATLDISLYIYGNESLETLNCRCQLAELYCKSKLFYESTYLYTIAQQTCLKLARENIDFLERAMEINIKIQESQPEIKDTEAPLEKLIDIAHQALSRGNTQIYKDILTIVTPLGWQSVENLVQRLRYRGIDMVRPEEERKIALLPK